MNKNPEQFFVKSSSVLRKLQAYKLQLLKGFNQFWGAPISRNNFQWLYPKIRCVARNTEDNVKESRL